MRIRSISRDRDNRRLLNSPGEGKAGNAGSCPVLGAAEPAQGSEPSALIIIELGWSLPEITS